MTAERPLLIVDGDNLAHRAYHSMPKSVVGAQGRPINAIVGWVSMLVAVWDAEQPRAVFVGWDTLGVDTYRHALWPAYQAGREFEPSIVRQLEQLPQVARALGCGVGKAPGYEADDLIAAAVGAETRRGGTCLVLTNDKDSYQLASESVTVLSPKKGMRELARIGPAEVVQLFGVLPEQVPDFKALAGDPSDNIPGARGIGPKGAAALLLRHGTLDGVLEASVWPDAERAKLRAFREVARMRPDVPVVLPASGSPRWAEAAEHVRSLGAEGLAERLARRAEALF